MQESIKNKLHSRFLSEDKVPGVSVTKKVQDEEDDVNKKTQKDIKSKLDAYDKASGKKDGTTPPKRELSDEEEDIRKYVEKQGGMERLKFDGEVSDMYSERQNMAIAGDSKMGNETKTGKWDPKTGEGNGNTEPVWGASNVDFGKNLVKQTKKAKELDDESTITTRFYGDDAEIAPKGVKPITKSKKVAVESTNKNKEIIKEEKMKRLKFKKPFNGIEKALTLIPEHYKVDDKEFEMTDGNETYRVRWEGSLNEGKAVVLKGENKVLVNEDMAKIKHLFSYNSIDTLGIVKGKARVDENKVFNDIWSKTKVLLEEKEDR